MDGHTPYSEALGATMERAGISKRRLARHLRPDSPESMRRALHRYVNGQHEPEDSTKDEIEKALRDLGADTSELEALRQQSSLIEDLWARLQPGFRRLVMEEAAQVDFTARFGQ